MPGLPGVLVSEFASVTPPATVNAGKKNGAGGTPARAEAGWSRNIQTSTVEAATFNTKRANIAWRHMGSPSRPVHPCRRVTALEHNDANSEASGDRVIPTGRGFHRGRR